jgi:hypothetical protein
MTEPSSRPLSACKDFESDLVVCYYGDAPEEIRSRVEAHLLECASCRRFVDDLRSVLPLTVKPDDPPPEFWDAFSSELREKIGSLEAKGSWKVRFLSWLPARRAPALALAAVLLTVLSFSLTRGVWRSSQVPFGESELQTILGTKEDKEFFESLELLESMELLESVDAGRTDRERA